MPPILGVKINGRNSDFCAGSYPHVSAGVWKWFHNFAHHSPIFHQLVLFASKVFTCPFCISLPAKKVKATPFGRGAARRLSFLVTKVCYGCNRQKVKGQTLAGICTPVPGRIPHPTLISFFRFGSFWFRSSHLFFRNL